MLVNASRLIGMPALSLHIGGPTAWTRQAIIDPKKLQIVGFYVDGPLVNDDTGDILETDEIREFAPIGMVIDSVDVLTHGEDAVRLKKIIDMDFEFIGLNVVSKKGEKLGKVSDYVVDTQTFKIMQFTVKRPLFKGFLDPELILSRKEIVEIDDEKVIVKDSEEKVKKMAAVARGEKMAAPDYVNPFRGGAYRDSSSE